MRRSTLESMEKTPTKTPAGGRESKLSGGKAGSMLPYETFGKKVGEPGGSGRSNGGARAGLEQYARHGSGSLSGLRIYMSSNVSAIANAENKISVMTWKPSAVASEQHKTYNSDWLSREKWVLSYPS